jgi:hypothetical protein
MKIQLINKKYPGYKLTLTAAKNRIRILLNGPHGEIAKTINKTVNDSPSKDK